MKTFIGTVLLCVVLAVSSAMAYTRYTFPDGNWCDVPGGQDGRLPPLQTLSVPWGFPVNGQSIYPVYFSGTRGAGGINVIHFQGQNVQFKGQGVSFRSPFGQRR